MTEKGTADTTIMIIAADMTREMTTIRVMTVDTIVAIMIAITAVIVIVTTETTDTCSVFQSRTPETTKP
jgi:hypothetical protein